VVVKYIRKFLLFEIPWVNNGVRGMDSIKIEYHDDVAVIKLNNGVTNPLSLEFLREISKNLENLKNESSACSLVIASNNDKFFSIGFNIPQLYEQSEEEVKEFYKTYNRLCLDLYKLPKPTIAAITGHAIAGGCILALCCDFRFIAEGKKLMGLNEIKLGVPVPYPGDCILRELVGMRNARDIMEIGEFYPPLESLKLGMVDQVLPLKQVLTEAIERAKLLGAMPQEVFGIIKLNRVERIEEQILKHLEEKEQFFLECWHSDETRKRLKEAIKKF